MKTALALSLLLLAPGVVRAENDAPQKVPLAMQGRWAPPGQCGRSAKVVTFTADQISTGGQTDKVYYSPDAAPNGDGAVFFAEEGEVGNYQFNSAADKIIDNEEGFGMGAPALLERCLPVAGTRTRCGWLANLTPNDMWLVDKEATWVITSQAGAQSAAGLDRLPDFDRRQFLRTAGDYGYGCACMKVLTGPEQTISVIFSARIQAIAICKADGSLPPLSRW